MKKFIIVVVLGFLALGTSKAQEEFTLYYLDKAIPSQYVNSMAQPTHKVSVGIPGLSSYGFGFFNSGFSLRSMLTLDGNTATFDLNRMVDKMNKVNFVTAGTSVDILSARVKIQENTYSLTFRNVADFRLSYPKGIFSILTEGNLNEPAFKGLGAQVNVYNELGLGFTRYDELKKLNYGGRAKILFGIANIDANADMTLEVNEDELYQMDVTLDAKYRSASVFFGDEFLDGDAEPTPGQFIFGGGNLGLGLDGSASYKWDDKLSFHGSVVDLGFIRWNTNPTQIDESSSFTWDGVEISGSDFEDIDSLEAALEDLGTELEEEFEDLTDLDSSSESYSRPLFTKLYLTAHYQILPKTRLSGTMFTEFNKGIRPGWILAVTQDVTKNFQVAVDYWGWRNSYSNLGLGFVWNFGPFQYHMMFDNIWPTSRVPIDTGAIDGEPTGDVVNLPYNFRNFNMRFGFGLLFGKLREGEKQSNSKSKKGKKSSSISK